MSCNTSCGNCQTPCNARGKGCDRTRERWLAREGGSEGREKDKERGRGLEEKDKEMEGERQRESDRRKREETETKREWGGQID